VAQFQHPNIVADPRGREADGHPYCALEFVVWGSPPGKLGCNRCRPGAAKLVEALARAMPLAHTATSCIAISAGHILLAADARPIHTDFQKGLALQRLTATSGETQAGVGCWDGPAIHGHTPKAASVKRATRRGPARNTSAAFGGRSSRMPETGRPPFRG